jgi:heteromeric Ino2p/Ino4p transcription factor
LPSTSPFIIAASDRPRLTKAQKEEHIRSEQKRRKVIRQGFGRLASTVPSMEGQDLSEAVVLNATLQYMREQIIERQKLITKAKERGINTAQFKRDAQTVKAAEDQLKRNALDVEGQK